MRRCIHQTKYHLQRPCDRGTSEERFAHPFNNLSYVGPFVASSPRMAPHLHKQTTCTPSTASSLLAYFSQPAFPSQALYIWIPKYHPQSMIVPA